ncbi:MAG: hypothetical protein KKD31_01510 [Bacteroidetes bacterium]|nr:hypothetical protein [Bacteroidota bacterium]
MKRTRIAVGRLIIAIATLFCSTACHRDFAFGKYLSGGTYELEFLPDSSVYANGSESYGLCDRGKAIITNCRETTKIADCVSIKTVQYAYSKVICWGIADGDSSNVEVIFVFQTDSLSSPHKTQHRHSVDVFRNGKFITEFKEYQRDSMMFKIPIQFDSYELNISNIFITLGHKEYLWDCFNYRIFLYYNITSDSNLPAVETITYKRRKNSIFFKEGWWPRREKEEYFHVE